MELEHLITPANVVAAVLALIPFLATAFFPERMAGWVGRLPAWLRYSCPALLSLPFVLVTCFAGSFRWSGLHSTLRCPLRSRFCLARLLELMRPSEGTGATS